MHPRLVGGCVRQHAMPCWRVCETPFYALCALCRRRMWRRRVPKMRRARRVRRRVMQGLKVRWAVRGPTHIYTPFLGGGGGLKPRAGVTRMCRGQVGGMTWGHGVTRACKCGCLAHTSPVPAPLRTLSAWLTPRPCLPPSAPYLPGSHLAHACPPPYPICLARTSPMPAPLLVLCAHLPSPLRHLTPTPVPYPSPLISYPSPLQPGGPLDPGPPRRPRRPRPTTLRQPQRQGGAGGRGRQQALQAPHHLPSGVCVGGGGEGALHVWWGALGG